MERSAPEPNPAGVRWRCGPLAGWPRIAAAAAVAWLLLSISAVAAGDLAGVARDGGALLIVVVAVAAARRPEVRRGGAVALALYLAALIVATLVAGATSDGTGDDARIRLFTGDPNVLGAALVTAVAAWAAVAPRRRWVWWLWPLVALAVLHTGSRTSGAALLAAGTTWLVGQAVRSRSQLALAPPIALVLLAAAAVAWQRGVVEMTPNLLAAPSDLRDPAWRGLAERLDIIDADAPGPFEGTSAQRIVARAAPTDRHIVHQSIGSSEEGVPYVASVYLRADTPQQVLLTSHLARVFCDVDETWRRCVTPVGYGDDYTQRQIHLQATVRGGSVDVHVFGAQYERGAAATAFVDARPAWLPQAMVNRYDLRRLTFLPTNRIPPWRAGLEIARAHPWFGAGLPASRDAFLASTGETLGRAVTYAHHGLLQVLAVRGLIGLLGIAILAGALLSAAGRAGSARLAPLLVALALLNTWDVTLLAWPVFAPALWAAASSASGPIAAPPPADTLRRPRPRIPP